MKAHLSLYSSPEAVYVGLGGESDATEALLPVVPSKAVLTVTPALHDLVTRKLRYDAKYTIDFMVVRRGDEKLKGSGLAKRLSREHDAEYATFGSSFNVREMTPEWAREQLENDIVFGTFANGKLASVASLVAWLPQVAAIMGVETKPEFRKRGLGSTTVSAVVREALMRSRSCSLFVRSDNHEAVRLYKALGFNKFGEAFFIDIGTGVVP